jgi:hypothetical protein
MISKTLKYPFRMAHHSVIISTNLFTSLASIWRAEAHGNIGKTTREITS